MKFLLFLFFGRFLFSSYPQMILCLLLPEQPGVKWKGWNKYREDRQGETLNLQALRGRAEGCQGSGCVAPHQDRDRSSGRKIQCCRLLAVCKTAFVFPFKLCQAVRPQGGCSALLRLLNFAIDKSASARKHRKAGVCLSGGKNNNKKWFISD